MRHLLARLLRRWADRLEPPHWTPKVWTEDTHTRAADPRSRTATYVPGVGYVDGYADWLRRAE